MHLWTYLVLRNGGGDALAKMVQSGDWNTDACTKAGEAVLALNKLDPYQAGYKSATYNDEAASVGNGKAAMELMGQWAPSVQKDQSANKTGLGDKLGWFAFPTMTGGAGAATDGVGGGNGIAVGKNAPPEAIDFLKFFMNTENQNKLNTDGVGLVDRGRHRERDHRPEPAGRSSPDAVRPRSCSSTSTRRPPGRWAPRSTTRPRRCSSASPIRPRSARPSRDAAAAQ